METGSERKILFTRVGSERPGMPARVTGGETLRVSRPQRIESLVTTGFHLADVKDEERSVDKVKVLDQGKSNVVRPDRGAARFVTRVLLAVNDLIS